VVAFDSNQIKKIVYQKEFQFGATECGLDVPGM
jgi:hypothetical protein